MRVVIAGSRELVSYAAVVEAMATAALFDIVPTVIFSGGARGADTLGERWAEHHRLPVHQFLPTWTDKHGVYNPKAGFERNITMLNAADALVAVWDGQSPGTRQAITYALLHRKIPTWVHRFGRHK